jgi:cytochrome P450
MSITVQLDLPEALAEKARAAGLLQERRLTAMIEEAVERDKQAREFITLLDQIRAQPGEPMSMEEIQAEVDAVRAEARSRRETGR